MVHSSEPSPVLFPCRLKYRYEATNTLRDFTTALSVSHQPEAGIRLTSGWLGCFRFCFPPAYRFVCMRPGPGSRLTLKRCMILEVLRALSVRIFGTTLRRLGSQHFWRDHEGLPSWSGEMASPRLRASQPERCVAETGYIYRGGRS
jgi:hypothetical protein